jgi:hypothetical protein
MAHTAGTLYGTEYAGNHKTVTVLVDGGSLTGTITFAGLTTIRGAQITPAEAPNADATNISINRVSTNTVVVSQYATEGTIATQNTIDYYLTVIGEI